jgi:hypothetical protein
LLPKPSAGLADTPPALAEYTADASAPPNVSTLPRVATTAASIAAYSACAPR